MKCIICGHDIGSNKAKCPFCGTRYHFTELILTKKELREGTVRRMGIAGALSEVKVRVPAGAKNGTRLAVKNVPFEGANHVVIITLKAKKSGIVWKIFGVMMLILIAVGIIFGAGDSCRAKKADEAAEETLTAPEVEYIPIDPENSDLQISEMPEVINTDEIEIEDTEDLDISEDGVYGEDENELYRDLLNGIQKSLISEDSEFNNYFLYDMDDDEMPELIVKTGTCEADATFGFYTIKNGAIRPLGALSASHMDLYPSESLGGMLYYNAQMGYEKAGGIRVGACGLETAVLYESEREVESYICERYSMESFEYLPLAGTIYTNWSGNPRNDVYSAIKKEIKNLNEVQMNEKQNAGLSYGKEQEGLYSELLKKIEAELVSTEFEYNNFILYDLDGNAIPELIVTTGTSAADRAVNVYTINGGEVTWAGQVKIENGAFYSSPSLGGLMFISEDGSIETVGHLYMYGGKAGTKVHYALDIGEAQLEPITELYAISPIYPYYIGDNGTETDSALVWSSNGIPNGGNDAYAAVKDEIEARKVQ